jgi:Ca2+-binding EF-hand superfamily protein
MNGHILRCVAVVARSPDRATGLTEGLPPCSEEETFGRRSWHGQETVPHRAKAQIVRCAAGLFAAGALAACLSAGDAPAVGDRHDFVYLSETRPVLIRVHVRLDGKPVQAAWDGFMNHLFDTLAVNRNGVLSKEEAERAPTLSQILTGGISGAFGAIPGMGKTGGAPTMQEFDTDKDGKVSVAELAAYYRKGGFLPLQVEPDAGQQKGFGGLAIFGGGRPEPTVQAVAESIFDLLDADKDGKLTKEELAAAPTVLLQRDEDDDEMITAAELAPGKRAAGNMVAGAMAMGLGGGNAPKGNKALVALAAPGETPADLVRRLQERYGPKADKVEEKKLSRADLGLDEATFQRLDTNGDGVLDAAELAEFVKRPPDVELRMSLGYGGSGSQVAPAAAKDAPLAGKLQFKSGLARLDLGRTRVDLRASNTYRPDRLAGLLRQQVVAQFKQADKDKNGYLDEQEARNSRVFTELFKAADKDGDGRLYEHEVIAYLDALADLQQRARAACVTLVLTNQSRGLFDALDVDRDGRLSVREMRGAVALLQQLDTGGKGYLTRGDLPSSFDLTLRRGPTTAVAFNPAAAFFDQYGGSSASDQLPELTAGPTWFRKMDRNRDGDVSRREFLGTDEEFRQIDTDGDGLISLEEAERFDARMRKLP